MKLDWIKRRTYFGISTSHWFCVPWEFMAEKKNRKHTHRSAQVAWADLIALFKNALYIKLAEPVPSFARDNSINRYFRLSLSGSTAYFTLSMDQADPDTLLLSPPCGSDGSRLSVNRSSRSWAFRVCPAHCPLQLTPSHPCSSPRKLLTSTGTTQLSHAGLAILIGTAIYDLCRKWNIRPRFRPQNSLVMQLCIAYVLLVDPKVSHAKNEPDPWRTESARGAQTYISEQLYRERR